jgi:N-acetylmuramoyl-L-alanine amidase
MRKTALLPVVLLLLLAGCDDPPPEPAREDVAAVASETDADIRRVVKALESKNGWVSLDALEYLPTFGRAAVPPLLEELASPSSNGRTLAAVALAAIPDARAVAPLIGLLGDEGGLVLNTLTEDGEAIQLVYPKPEHTVKQQALIALGAITGKHFAKAEEWQAFWAKEGSTFQVALPAAEPEPPLPYEAQWLRGVKICLDPGHGGDRSKQGYKRGLTYLSEADLNLRVARYLRDLLQRAGAVVLMTRYGDRDVSLKDRCKVATAMKADLFLSIHHNWSPSLTEVTTTTWYHFTPDEKPAAIDLARFVEDGVQNAYDPKAPHRAGGLMSDNLIYNSGFAVLRDLSPEIPGTLCEATYYSNFPMERRLRDPATQKKEAQGFLVGLSRYMAAGIPRAEIVSAGASEAVLQVFDGLEERKEWAKPWKIFSEHTLVKVDGALVPHAYDKKTGRITLKGPFAAGAHAIDVALININKNHSWPKRLHFNVE